jgi:hypothetical protein
VPSGLVRPKSSGVQTLLHPLVRRKKPNAACPPNTACPPSPARSARSASSASSARSDSSLGPPCRESPSQSRSTLPLVPSARLVRLVLHAQTNRFRVQTAAKSHLSALDYSRARPYIGVQPSPFTSGFIRVRPSRHVRVRQVRQAYAALYADLVRCDEELVQVI